MREIKFRGWDVANKKMYQASMRNIYRNPNSPFGDIYLYQTSMFGETVRVELMQYTGLKDKNGVEIYEGDIFKAPHDFGPGGMDERTAQVHFHPLHGYQWNYWDVEKLEVIGNIYENPELLKGESE